MCVYEKSETNSMENIVFDSYMYGTQPSLLNPLWGQIDINEVTQVISKKNLQFVAITVFTCSRCLTWEELYITF